MFKAWLAAVIMTLLIGLFIFSQPFFASAPEQPKPFSFAPKVSEGATPTSNDHISQQQVTVYDDKIVIDLEGRQAVWSTYTPTGSMLPTFTEGHNGIEIIPKCPEEIGVGDIIAYQYDDLMVVHRVIETGIDSEGWFAYAKGDNNQVPDPMKIRCDMIKRLTIGILF